MPRPCLGLGQLLRIAAIFWLSISSGCALVPDIRSKPQLINPFPQLQRIAVLPFFNQSEEPTLSGERVALAYSNELAQIRGFEVLPLGAVKSKMQAYAQPLASGEDFQNFAKYLGVDAVLVGSITDYTAYYPPRMTMKVNWYSSNPGFHPVHPGYGLPWGTKEEKKIPRWVHQEAQRSLAAEQLKSQTPQMPLTPEELILPEDRAAAAQASHADVSDPTGLPSDWPDPRGFIPDGPQPTRPPLLAQHDPIIAHMRSFNGHDEDLTEQLEEYFYFRDDARFGGWQAYLQRSEDFIRFCCHQHLSETLICRGGQDKSRLIFRWPIDRYLR
jgi:hypothetical protein